MSKDPATIYKLLNTTTNVDEKTRTVEVICSTSTPDRIGDVIVQDGIDLTAYRKNPVVLWGHDSDRPVARGDKVFLQNGQLRAITEFPPEGEDPDSDWVYGKVKNRLVNAVSIGFIPKEWEPVDPKNPWNGYKYLESEMVEFSFCTVPMNAEALIVGRSLMLPKTREFLLPSRAKLLPPEEQQVSVDWQLGMKTLPITAEGEWDSCAAAHALFVACRFGGEEPDLEMLRRGFLMHDAAKPNEKTSYRLPIGVFTDGKMVAHQAGLEFAAGVLDKAEVPADVRTRAAALIEHYRGRIEADGKQFAVRTSGEWKVAAARDLPIDDSDGWDGSAAAKRMLDAAGFDGDSPDTAKARRGFLIFDSGSPELRSSYKLPFADVVDGSLKAVKGGIRAAASRLEQTDAPEEVLTRARTVIDHYEARMGMDSEDGKALIDALFRSHRSLDEILARAHKSGRVLSAGNEERLRAAHASIGEVLDQLPAPADDGSQANPAPRGGGASNIRSRQTDGDSPSATLRFPRRAAREAVLLRMRSA